MKVKRIVTNIGAEKVEAAKSFYGGILGLEVLVDLGWIATWRAELARRSDYLRLRGGSPPHWVDGLA